MHFAAADNLLTFLTTDLDTANRSSNPPLLDIFERHATAVEVHT